MTPDADIAHLVDRINSLGLSVLYTFQVERLAPPSDDTISVMSFEDLKDCQSPAHRSLLEKMAARGMANNERVISAALALRVGWTRGFEIGAYLLDGLLAHVADASIVVQKGVVRHVVIHRATLETTSHLSASERQQRMAETLYSTSLPFVQTHHAWSRLSTRAIFSMIESSQVGQFVSMGEALGRCDAVVTEVRAIFAAHPVLRQDVPDLQEIEAGGRRKFCQRRTLCCLYYKMPSGGYCGSCPILSDDERNSRHLKFVAEYGIPISATGETHGLPG